MIPIEEPKTERKRSGRVKKVEIENVDTLALADLIGEIKRSVNLPCKISTGHYVYVPDINYRRVRSWLVIDGKVHDLHRSGFLYPDNVEKLITNLDVGCLATTAEINTNTELLRKLVERWKKNVVVEQLSDSVKGKEDNRYSKYYIRDVEQVKFTVDADESLIRLKAKCLDVLKTISVAEDKRVQYLNNITPVINSLLSTLKRLSTKVNVTYGGVIEIYMDDNDKRSRCVISTSIQPNDIKHIVNNPDKILEILENTKKVSVERADVIIRLIKGEPIEVSKDDGV